MKLFYTKLFGGVPLAENTSQQRSSRELIMLNEPISRVIPKMAIPTIVAFLITSVYNLADTYFVSSLGTNATAAVSVNGSLDQIIMMAVPCWQPEPTAILPDCWVPCEKEKANRVLSTAFFLAAAFGLIILGLGTVFIDSMVRLLGATDSCETYSVQYATYVLLVAPFMATSFVMNQCLRAEGSAMLSMIGMGFGGVLNCFLDPLFIFGFGLGVTGASMATAISKLVSFGILIFPYLTKRSLLRISFSRFRPTKEILYQIVSVGSASMFRSALGVVSGIALNNIAGSISDSVLAGIGVSTKIMMFPFSFILGFGAGFQPVAGFNWGAEALMTARWERHRLPADDWRLPGSVIAGLALRAISAPQVIQLFTESDPDMMYIGSLCIRLQCVALPIHAWGGRCRRTFWRMVLGYVRRRNADRDVPPGQLPSSRWCCSRWLTSSEVLASLRRRQLPSALLDRLYHHSDPAEGYGRMVNEAEARISHAAERLIAAKFRKDTYDIMANSVFT